MSELAPSSSFKISWFLGILAVFALFALIGAYSFRMTNDYASFDQQRAQARYATLAKLRADEDKTLTTSAWIDQDKGTVRIPIQEAMVKEVDTLQAKPVAIGQAIPGATPAPAPAAPASAPSTNAPAAPAAKTAPAAKPKP